MDARLERILVGIENKVIESADKGELGLYTPITPSQLLKAMTGLSMELVSVSWGDPRETEAGLERTPLSAE